MFEFLRELKRIKVSEHVSRHEAALAMEKIKLPSWLATISAQMGWVVILTMWTGAAFSSAYYTKYISRFFSADLEFLRMVLISLLPLVFAFSFVLIGSFYARLSRAGIVAGKFPRLASHPIYALRRIYGTAWTQVFYFKPLYAAFLALPFLKKALFRLFGYRGPTNFVLYPDAWVRDLPLLKIGEGAYLANRCTIGTNICLNDGSIIVGECSFADKSLVGHLVIFGLGCKLGKSSELGIGVSLGIRINIKDRAIVLPRASIYHGAEIGEGAKIGACALIGMKAKIGDGVELKLGAVIPNGAQVLTQTDADRFFSAELDVLRDQKEDLTEILRKNLDEFIEGRR